jgi:hypothetical protein
VLVQVKSGCERSTPCGVSEEWRDNYARLERGQMRATWWQEKQDEVVDRSWCRVVAHNRSLHAGFTAVHHKTGRVTWLSQKPRPEGGRRRDPGAPRNFDADEHMAGSQDLRGRTRTAAKVWPCDEEECYMTYFPLRRLYLNVSARGSFVICPTQRDSYILTLGFLGKPSFRTTSHFLTP